MGLDINMVSLKRTKLREIQKKYPNYESSHLYEDFFNESHSNNEDSNQFGTWILSLSHDIFKEFFNQIDFSIKPEELMFIDEEIFNKLLQWLESKLKETTLMDLIKNGTDLHDIGLFEFVMAYKNMKETNIDFDEDILVIEYN